MKKMVLLIFTVLLNANCTKNDIIKLIDGGYKKYEINKICKNNKNIIYKTYINSRFGFSLLYPSNILTKKEYPINGDGAWLYNKSHTVELVPSASFAIGIKNIKQKYSDSIDFLKKNNIKITYHILKRNWFVLSGYDYTKKRIFYKKEYLINGVRSGFVFYCPINQKNKFNKIIIKISHSFKPSFGEL